LEPPLGSGAYRIKVLKPGRSITYERVKNYWAADLPVNRGLGNVDEIRYDYFRDATVMFEAFKAGDIDFRTENRAQRWATGYEFDAVAEGRVIRRLVPDETPRGIQAYFFNLRRPQFTDRRVRAGIAELYDFEFVQRTLLHGQYRRTTSYFPNSDFGSKGEPNAAERAILEPFADKLAPEILTKAFAPTVSDGKGRIRRQQRKALDLFKAAGWTVKDGKMVDNQSGKQLKIEILMRSPASERITAPLVQNLKKVGIDASMRLVDTAQFQVRMDDFDYDMVSVGLNFFPPPGPELRSYYGSAAAGERGSANLAGVKDPVADALIEKIIAAKDLESLKAHSRALDRVLLWGHYVVPMFHNDQYRLAYWDHFGYPKRRPRYSHGFPTSWWIKE
jgi:microcin C transport system substrate-binding protein